MKSLIRILIERLVNKGMEITSIPAFIRNLATCISNDPDISMQDLNIYLRSLGWEDFELDSYTLNLVMATFESDFKHQPNEFSIKTRFNPKQI